MRSETHELVTRLALSAVMGAAVVQVPRWFGERLVDANTDLDRNPEYEREVVFTKRGDLKSMEKRVPHHTSSEKRILRKLDRVRLDVLEGRLTREGAQRLGEALHYIQDRCVPSPKFDRRLHDRVEKEAARAHGVLSVAALYSVPRPVGRGGLKVLLRQQSGRKARSGEEAVRCAIAYTFAALYAVLANPKKAPEDFVEKAVYARKAFGGAARWIYAGAALASMVFYAAFISAALPLALNDLSFAVLFLFPVVLLASSPYVGALALATLLSRDLQGFLRNLARATNPENAVPETTALVFIFLLPPLHQLLAVITFASTIIVRFSPYLSRNFRAVREEAYWFEWE